MNHEEEETSDKNLFQIMWEVHKGDKNLKKMMWVALIIVLLVILATALPFVFNALARVIRSYKDLQCCYQRITQNTKGRMPNIHPLFVRQASLVG